MLWLLLGCAGLVAQAATSPFLTVWRTTSTDENITLPFSVSVFNVTVRWGDGSQPEIINSTSIATHKYSLPGLYDVSINGDFNGFFFGGAGDAAKLMEIVSWGDGFIMSVFNNVFAGCVNLKVSAPPSTQPVFLPGTTLAGMFMNSSFNSSLDWDLTNIISVASMFRDATSLNQPIRFSNTFGVMSTSLMFAGATSFNQTLTMQTTNVMTMDSMFEGASSFNQPVTFNTAKTMSMNYMFSRTSAFNQPINFNGSALTQVAYMFRETTVFNSVVNLTNTGNGLVSTNGMFRKAVAFNQPVTFNTRKVQSMQFMFAETSAFNQPVNFDASSVTDTSFMFSGAMAFNSVVNLTNTSFYLTNVIAMFQNTVAFNQPIYMRTDNLIYMHYMFNGARSFNQPVPFNTANVQTMQGVFQAAAEFNQPINFNTPNLTSAASMFARASAFNSIVTFTSTPALESTASMFQDATTFNQTISFSVANVQDMNSMFKNATSFNSPLLWPSTDTRNVTTMANMLDGASSFNQVINFQVDKLSTTDSMLRGATSFNQPVVLLSSNNLTSTSRMFANATAFNQTVVISTTQNVVSMRDMFANVIGYEQDLRSWDVGSAVDCSNFCYRCGLPYFDLCTPCNSDQPLYSESGIHVCNCPSGEVNISPIQCGAATPAPTAVPTTVVPSAPSVPSIAFVPSAPSPSAPSAAPSPSAPSVPSIAFAPSAAPSPSAPSAARSPSAPSPAPSPSAPSAAPSPFAPSAAPSPSAPSPAPSPSAPSPAPSPSAPSAAPSPSTPSPAASPYDPSAAPSVPYSPSTSTTSAPSAPSTPVTFTPSAFYAPSTFAPSASTSSFPTSAAQSLTPTTVVPSVPTAPSASSTGPSAPPSPSPTSPTSPTTPTASTTASSIAPSTAPPTAASAPTTIAPTPDSTPSTINPGGPDICTAVQVSSNLQAECIIEPLPSGPSFFTGIVSPLFNITQTAEANETSFVFTLPIDPRLYVEMGKISRPCESQALSCEWQDPETLAFQRSGCTVSKARVDMGSGVVGTECTCAHLTVFAIALRSEMQLAPLCQAQEVDYVLMVLYAMLGGVLVSQVARVVRYHPITRRFGHTRSEGAAAQASIAQHLLLLLVCVLRIVYLVTKPMIASLVGLVLLGLLPSAVTLSLFIHLLLTWASLQLATFEASPFARFRVPFVVMTMLVFMAVIILAIMVGVAPEVDTYVLAALYAAVCVLVLISGLGMRKSISVGDALRATDWRVVFRCRLLVATLGLSTCLFVTACLWVAAVQSDIITSSAGTLAATVAFYACDWLSLGMLTWLFSFAVTEITDQRDRRRGGRNTASSKTSKKDESDSSKKDDSSKRDDSDSRTRAVELEA